MANQSVTRSGKSSSQRRSEAQSVVRSTKGDLQISNVPKTTDTNPIGRRYAEPIGPSNRGSVQGGYGIPGLSNVRMTPTANAPRATVTGTRVVPAAQVISNVVRERTSPTPSRTTSAPARMEVNRTTGNTTGFTSGTTTGSTMTKSGTAYKTSESAYERQQRMAAEKSGGSMRSTGGGSGGSSSSRSSGSSSNAGNRGTGPAGMGYSGSGTGSKR